jgi:transcriptional regulator GlxA family with amidase domain
LSGSRFRGARLCLRSGTNNNLAHINLGWLLNRERDGAFTERFKSLVGMPPLSYLIRWRMAVAGAALRSGKSLSAIAESVGYGSDVAFNSAFKRTTGRSPGRYRSEKEENVAWQSDLS